MSYKVTILTPENDETTDLYPKIVTECIPSGCVTKEQLDKTLKGFIDNTNMKLQDMDGLAKSVSDLEERADTDETNFRNLLNEEKADRLLLTKAFQNLVPRVSENENKLKQETFTILPEALIEKNGSYFLNNAQTDKIKALTEKYTYCSVYIKVRHTTELSNGGKLTEKYTSRGMACINTIEQSGLQATKLAYKSNEDGAPFSFLLLISSNLYQNGSINFVSQGYSFVNLKNFASDSSNTIILIFSNI